MTLYQLAQRIPHKYRKKLLEENHIYKAVCEFHDGDMMKLWWYYANFIEPGNEQYKYQIISGKVIVENNCKVCLGEMLKKWQELLPHLIELEKGKNLLKCL